MEIKVLKTKLAPFKKRRRWETSYEGEILEFGAGTAHQRQNNIVKMIQYDISSTIISQYITGSIVPPITIQYPAIQ
jgi:hypothetical protein